MDHTDHVTLLRGGVLAPGGVWADLGSGTGAFTLALAELLGPTGVIYSVDKDAGALAAQERALRARFPATSVHILWRPISPAAFRCRRSTARSWPTRCTFIVPKSLSCSSSVAI